LVEYSLTILNKFDNKKRDGLSKYIYIYIYIFYSRSRKKEDIYLLKKDNESLIFCPKIIINPYPANVENKVSSL